MSDASSLVLTVLSLRYSSWSIRPWLALAAADACFETRTVEVEGLNYAPTTSGAARIEEASQRLSQRRDQGSVTGLFPVLCVDGRPIHESLAICEWAADAYPAAGLWPQDATDRAQARAICCEMMTGFQDLRRTMSCHVFARVPDFPRDAATEVDILRVFELWRGALDRSGGPFLAGAFGIPDCMYFPVITRFRTYDVELPAELEDYARRVEAHPAVERWRSVASTEPAIEAYDEMIRGLGGDPAAAAVTPDTPA